MIPFPKTPKEENENGEAMELDVNQKMGIVQKGAKRDHPTGTHCELC